MSPEEIKDLFVNNGATLGSVESFTGGLFASSITKISGASKFFKGALVTYATEEKERLLGIDHSKIEKFGVVSSEIALDMANLGKEVLDVDYCVSFTGNAGPNAMENKPVGLVYICVSDGKNSKVVEKNLNGNRENIQGEAILIAYDIISAFFCNKK